MSRHEIIVRVRSSKQSRDGKTQDRLKTVVWNGSEDMKEEIVRRHNLLLSEDDPVKTCEDVDPNSKNELHI